MKPKKLDCLEGVRALACIGVVLCHLKGAFLPNLHLADVLSRTPLFYLYSGNTAVRIMFILSGFVLSYKYFRVGETHTLERDAVKRYIRLALPAAFVTLMVFAMMRFNLLYNGPAGALTGSVDFLGNFNQFEPNFKSALREGFWGVMFQKWATYVGPLWTMTYEMLGSYLVFAVVAMLKNRRARYVFYVIYLLIFPAYYIYFVLGMMICDLYTGEEKLNLFLQKHSFLTIGLHAAAWYYIGAVTNLDVFKWKSLLFDLAAVLMFLTLLNSRVLDRLWGNKAGVALGKHGFSIYLLHWPVIESFSSAYLCFFLSLGFARKWIILSDILLSIPVILLVSVFFTKLVVQPSNRLSDWFAIRVLGDKTPE